MTTRWVAALWILAVSTSVWGQSPPQSYFPITKGQVAQSLVDKGMEIVEGQVTLVASVVANDRLPVLDVLSVVPPIGDHNVAGHVPAQTWIKLACHVPGVCLPFYAIVSRPEPALLGSTKVSSSSSALATTILKPNLTIAMRVGARATLVIDDTRSHIQVAVISLENGIAGHRIRVTSPDHKHVYFGEVVSASLLKGSY